MWAMADLQSQLGQVEDRHPHKRVRARVPAAAVPGPHRGLSFVLLGDGPDLREGRGVRRVWMGVLLRHDLQLHIVELVVAELERNEEREDVVGRCLKGTFPTQCRELSWCTFEDGGNDQVNGEGSQPCAGP